MQVSYEFIIMAIQILSGIPLMAYPAILIANIMSIAAFRSGNVKPATSLREHIFRCFIYYSTFYPLIYGLSYWLANYYLEHAEYGHAILISTSPLIILLLLFKWSMK
jgi:hypothetical protein